MPPLPKTCPKMVLSNKGGSLCVKDVLQKNFLVPGKIPRAARSHQFFGNTLLKAGHLMRLSVESGTVRGLALGTGTCRSDSETAPVKANLSCDQHSPTCRTAR